MSENYVVDGKKYDLEKMEKIGSYSYSNASDFRYMHEELYVSEKGNYLLVGEGGAMSKYSKPLGNNSTGGGSSQRVLSKAEALEWAENNCDGETVLKYFGDEIEEG